VFNPAASVIKCTYWEERLPFIKTIAGVGDWGEYQPTGDNHLGKVKAVVFSPDGELLATASHNPDLKNSEFTLGLWDAATGVCLETLKGHSHRVELIAFSPDGKTLVSGSDDCTIQIWDATTRALRQTLKGHSNSVKTIAFSPDSKLLALNSEDCIIQLWEVATGICQQTLSGESNQAQAVAFSADGKILASCSHHHTIRIWDVTTGVCRQTHTNMDPPKLILSGQGRLVQVVAFSPDDKTLVSGSDDGSVLLWNITTGVCRQMLSETGGQVWAVAFSPDGKTLAAGLGDTESACVVQLWDMGTGISRGTVPTLRPTLELSFSEDSRYLKTNRELIRVPSTLVFSDDSHNHVVGVSSGGLMGYLMMDGECVLPFPGFVTGRVAALCGDTVALVSDRSGRPIFLRLNLCRV
jgi:WD40 repeat protein